MYIYNNTLLVILQEIQRVREKGGGRERVERTDIEKHLCRGFHDDIHTYLHNFHKEFPLAYPHVGVQRYLPQQGFYI